MHTVHTSVILASKPANSAKCIVFSVRSSYKLLAMLIHKSANSAQK